VQLPGCQHWLLTDFLVVDKLIVPAVLGTPWIDQQVISIFPKKKTILVHLGENMAPVEVPLKARTLFSTSVVRAAKSGAIPAFSETWISVRTNRHGLSVIQPKRNRDSLLQAKNALTEVPENGQPFRILVANFSEFPMSIRKGQVVGLAEAAHSFPTLAIESVLQKNEESDWTDRVKGGLNHLTEDEQTRVLDTLHPHSSMWDGRLGEIPTVEHHIITEGPPIASQPYRAGPASREIIDKEIKRMLDMKVIEPSSGPWSAPIVLIPKPDGSIRFCVDYRKLNEATVNDSYALPRIDDCLDSLGSARYFTTVDANSGYWQINVAKEDREKTAFTSHRGLFQFLRMAFGLKTAPATFQRAIDVILSTVRFQCALTYLDDIVIYSPTFEQHLVDLNTVLTLLREAGVSLKISKCVFAAEQVQYLGLKVGAAGVEVDRSKTAAVEEARAPRTRTALRRFLGMTGYYRKFIDQYAKKAAPLTKYLKEDTAEPFDLGVEALEAHQNLKTAIVTAPVLALPKSKGMFVLETDASASQLGVQLLQEQDDSTWRPIGFWSRQCNSAESNYSPTEREALAIVWGIKVCRPYLERTKFKVRSDHQALRWLFSTSTSDGNPRVLRWKLALSAYDFSVEYKPGATNRVADELSRMETGGMSPIMESDGDEEMIPCLVVNAEAGDLLSPPSTPLESPLLNVPEPLEAISRTELARAQQDDTWCRDLIRLVEKEEPTQPPGVVLDDNGLLCCPPVKSELPYRWVAPSSLRERICTLHHFSKAVGHPGGTRMAENVARMWYWPKLAKDCHAMVRRCPSCAALRLKRGPKRTYPLTVFPPDRPLEFIAVDVLGPLPKTSRGNQYVLCICDRFSKMSIAVAMPDQTASTVARELVDRWIAPFGIPITILSDNGPCFASKFFQVLNNVLGVKHVFTSAYRPTTNGQVERWNATLVDMLTHLTREKDWDRSLGIACVAYNSSVHSTTGYAPIELSTTREPAPSVWSRQPSLLPRSKPEKFQHRQALLARAAKLCSAARETSALRLQRYKSLYDYHVRRRHSDLQVGDSVFVRTHMLEPGRSPKLSAPVAGPYPVIRIDGPNVDIRTREGKVRLHLDRVMRCPTDLPSGVEWAPQKDVPKTTRRRDKDPDDEYVIDYLVAHAPTDEGQSWLIRVRWSGFSRSDDTWEPVDGLPDRLVTRYERRKGLQPGTLSRRPGEALPSP
jgi:transposase InsO family protein